MGAAHHHRTGHHPAGGRRCLTHHHDRPPHVLWRAGCSGMSKSGSEGRGRQTTARERGTGGPPLTLRPVLNVMKGASSVARSGVSPKERPRRRPVFMLHAGLDLSRSVWTTACSMRTASVSRSARRRRMATVWRVRPSGRGAVRARAGARGDRVDERRAVRARHARALGLGGRGR